MRIFSNISANLAIISAIVAMLLFPIPAWSQPGVVPPVVVPLCVTVEKDIEGLELTLEKMQATGKYWLWEDQKFSISFVISTLDIKVAILTFYDTKGCRTVHPATGSIRTQLPLTDKIRAYIGKATLKWKNTDRIFLTGIRWVL